MCRSTRVGSSVPSCNCNATAPFLGCIRMQQSTLHVNGQKSRASSHALCSDILEELDEPAESAEVRLKIKADDFKRVADNTVDAFTAWLADGAGGAWQLDEPNFEGVRVKVRLHLFFFHLVVDLYARPNRDLHASGARVNAGTSGCACEACLSGRAVKVAALAECASTVVSTV